jgi:hypothetical protein
MKKLLVLFCALSVIFCAAVSAAQDKMKPLVGDNTLAVIHVELDKIDVVKTLNNNRQEIEKMFAGLGLPENKLHEILLRLAPQKSDNFDQNWKELATIADAGKKILTETCGIQEAFFVVQVDKIIPALGYIAIPKTEKFKSEPIRKLLKEGDKIWANINLDSVTLETEDYFFIAFTNVPTPEMKDTFTVNIGEIKPSERNDFTAAFNSVKNEPVKIIVAIPAYAKKIVAELKPKFPDSDSFIYSSLANLDISRFVNGLKFAAIGLNPEHGKMCVVVKTESESDSQQIAKQADVILTAVSNGFLSYLQDLEKRSDEKNSFLYDHEIILLTLYPEVLNAKSIASLKSQLVPKPDGDTFTVTFDAAKTGTLLIGSEIMLTKLVQSNFVLSSVMQSRKQCNNKMRQIGIAYLNHLDTTKKFPPAFSVDDNGKPLHSWRVLLLPYLNEDKLYKAIRLNEAWDSEHNKQFHNKMPNAFKCPSCKQGNPQSDTVYCMVTGEEAFGKTDGKGITFDKIGDGSSDTICIVERKTPVCWMSPEDVTFENAAKGINKIPNGIGSEHDRGANVVFIDTSVHFLKQDTEPNVIKAFLTIDGGEVNPLFIHEENKK